MADGNTSKTDGIWRIIVGISLIPAFGTLYQRLTLAESTRFIASQKVEEDGDLEKIKEQKATDDDSVTTPPVEKPVAAAPPKKTQIKEFLTYFSEWRHAKLLIGTSMSWFLLDIAFYGINLNQNVVLQEIGFAGTTGNAWHKLMNIGVGSLIITALGFVPGYWVTILTIEKLGRKWIQIQGFLLTAIILAVMAAKFHTLSKPAFIVCFTLLQFFFNFGANTTTYIYPAEVFPTKYKAFAHGISAASGKAGAIISALAFNILSQKVGTPIVLWIFFGCCIAGAFFSLLLPEVRGRDADVVLEEELKAARGL